MNIVFSNITERPFVTGNTSDPPETGTNCRAQDSMTPAQNNWIKMSLLTNMSFVYRSSFQESFFSPHISV